MDDEDRPPRSYETRPTRVERGGGRGSAAVVAFVVVAFVAVAVAKPWGGGATDPSGVSASPSAASPSAASEAVASAPGPTPPTLGGSDGGLVGPVVARLVEHSGDWGIGSGGWRLGSDAPWINWHSAVPIPDDPVDPRAAPDCGDIAVLGGGVVVAITAPRSIVPDWTVEALMFDEAGRPVPAAPVRQVSPPGNRGIAYLVRTDGKVWWNGAYRFRVTASSHVVDLDTCLLAL